MHTLALEWQAIWKILLTGLAFGAGLPTLFAVGIRALAQGTPGPAPSTPTLTQSTPTPAGWAVAALCFGLVFLAVALGITMIVASGFGKALDFSSVYPVLRDK